MLSTSIYAICIYVYTIFRRQFILIPISDCADIGRYQDLRYSCMYAHILVVERLIDYNRKSVKNAPKPSNPSASRNFD